MAPKQNKAKGMVKKAKRMRVDYKPTTLMKRTRGKKIPTSHLPLPDYLTE
jgi:hypothetical protein